MEEIEARVEQMISTFPEWLWDREALPVPVEDIVDTCFSLHVRDVEDLSSAPGAPELEEGQSLSGLLLAGRGEIWVNAAEAREWPPRRRFTIGHELGHWVMHRTGQQSLFCRDANVQLQLEPAEERVIPPLEAEANAFAAALLMPAFLIRTKYEETGGDFKKLCEIFDSSEAAMGKRLHAVVPRSGS